MGISFLVQEFSPYKQSPWTELPSQIKSQNHIFNKWLDVWFLPITKCKMQLWYKFHMHVRRHQSTVQIFLFNYKNKFPLTQRKALNIVWLTHCWWGLHVAPCICRMNQFCHLWCWIFSMGFGWSNGLNFLEQNDALKSQEWKWRNLGQL